MFKYWKINRLLNIKFRSPNINFRSKSHRKMLTKYTKIEKKNINTAI